MKRLRLCIVMLLVMFVLGGCAKPIELTDEETDMFAEYISKEVLERDKNYDQELLAQENDEDEEDEDGKQVPVVNTNNSVTNVNYVPAKTPVTKKESSLNALLGNSSIAVSYQSAKSYNSYPDDGSNYFVINSSKGYKLLVMTFDLKNTSNEDVRYSMLTSDINYSLTMENGSTYSPLFTLLIDDLQFVNKVIPANTTQDGLLVFRISEKEIGSKGTLQIESGTERTALELK